MKKNIGLIGEVDERVDISAIIDYLEGKYGVDMFICMLMGEIEFGTALNNKVVFDEVIYLENYIK